MFRTGIVAGVLMASIIAPVARAQPASPPPAQQAPPDASAYQDPLNCAPLTPDEEKKRRRLANAEFAQGANLLDANNTDAAIAHLDRNLCLDPRAIGWQDRGVARIRQHRPQQAVADLQKAHELDSGSTDIMIDLATAYMDSADFAKAIGTLDEVIAGHPNNLKAWQDRAAGHERMRDYAGSVADLEHVLSLLRDRDVEGRAQVWLDISGAWTLAKEYDKAIDAANQALAINPKEADGFRSRGLAKQYKHDIDGALEDFTLAISANKSWYRSYVNRAEVWIIKKDYARAIDDLTQAIANTKQPGTYYLRRAYVHNLAGDYDKAVADLDFEITIAPRDGRARSELVFLKLQHKDLTGALADANEIVTLWPDDPEAYAIRAHVRGAMKDYAAAIADYDVAIAHAPKSATYLSLRCLVRAYASQDLKGALADCDAALALAPTSPEALGSRGDVLLRMGKYDEAIAAFDAAIKANPKLWSAIYARGVAKVDKGDKEGGEVDIAAAQAGDPNAVDVLRETGIEPKGAAH